MLRVLTFTDLFPNVSQPRHGIFVENRVRMLVAAGDVEARVVAPVPYATSRFLKSGGPAIVDVPDEDVRHGIKVAYPRFPVVPRLTNWVNPVSMALAALPAIKRLRRQDGDFDLIDAHFFYPAGVAAILLGMWLLKPVVITARGSDINLHTQFHIQRAWILWAAKRACAVVTVSGALRASLATLGVPMSHITVVPNGVDLETFRLVDRAEARARLGWDRPTLLSIGNLVEEKGHDLVLEALQDLADVRLVIIGSGPEEARLRLRARQLNVERRVIWIPHLSQEKLRDYYAMADATVLASSREGMPNVLLESLACGTRVIASNVGGIPEIVSAPEAGLLLSERSARGVVDAYERLMASPANPEATRQFAERFGWAGPIARLTALLIRVASKNDAPPGGMPISQERQ